jgi:hypothetical protein
VTLEITAAEQVPESDEAYIEIENADGFTTRIHLMMQVESVIGSLHRDVNLILGRR